MAVEPGLTAFAVTPLSASSAASARISPVTPALAAQYVASIGSPRVAAADATARNRPDRGAGRRSSAGTAARASDSTPPRLTSSTACCCARGTSQSGTPPAITPAAAIAASRPPQRRSASATAAATAPGSRTSAVNDPTRPAPERPIAWRTTPDSSAGVAIG